MRRPILRVVLFTAVAALIAACGRDVGLVDPAPMTAPGSRSADIVFFDPNTFNYITSGWNHTCAVRNTGTTYCWGQNDQIQAGRWSSKCSIGFACITRPTVVLKGGYGPDSVNAIEIDAGSNHTCIRDSANDAWCWGSGLDGQNGQGGGNFGPIEAVRVAGGFKFQSIAAGGSSSCGTSSGVVLCWGMRETFMPSTSTPIAVSPDARYPWVAVGHRSGCVPQSIKSGVFIACWGMNGSGQLGIPGGSTPVAFAQASSLGSGVVAMSMSEDFTCVDRSNGTVACLGMNRFGQVGVDPALALTTSKPQTIANGMQLHGVTTGSSHACALDAANAAWCWGLGTSGQLGNGRTNSSTSPLRVAGGIAFSRLAAGAQHTCGIGLDNHIYCWGGNSFGQLGVGGNGGGFTSTPMQAIDP